MVSKMKYAVAVDQKDVWHVYHSQDRRLGADRVDGAMRLILPVFHDTKKSARALARFMGGGRRPEGV